MPASVSTTEGIGGRASVYEMHKAALDKTSQRLPLGQVVVHSLAATVLERNFIVQIVEVVGAPLTAAAAPAAGGLARGTIPVAGIALVRQ